MVNNCYIHIPFCKKICSYCDFCKLFYNTGYVSSYLEALEKEILKFYQKEELETIYIGGGTPSCLSINELEKLFLILSTLKRTESCEITIEANFDSITEEKINLFKKHGINRISFGLETTHSWILKKMNRTLDKKHVKHIISYCKSIGITNINIDLMYAFPKESLEELSADIDFILSLNIPHISTYSLMIEDHTKLYLDQEKSISEDIDAEMYELICKKLVDFDHYEISNFAKSKFYSKHNLCYWKNKEYYGFGLGASGYIKNIRYSNTRSITNYLKKEFRYDLQRLDIYDKISYAIILNLRTRWGIIKKEFKQIYNKELSEVYNYSELITKGYLIESENAIIIPKKYWYTSNEIIVKLLEKAI